MVHQDVQWSGRVMQADLTPATASTGIIYAKGHGWAAGRARELMSTTAAKKTSLGPPTKQAANEEDGNVPGRRDFKKAIKVRRLGNGLSPDRKGQPRRIQHQRGVRQHELDR